MENLYAAIVEQMQEYTPMDPMDILIYETGMGESPIYDKNQSVMVNVVNMIGRLIEECIKLIKGILGSIRNCIDYVFLSKEDKERYQQYYAYIRTHPDAGKKKVSVKDWKRIEKHYADAIRRAELLSQKVANKSISKEEAKKEEKSIVDSIGNVLSTSTAIVTVDYALKMASSSTDAAKLIQQTLASNQQYMMKLQQELGSKEAIKFQKNVAKMTKDTYFTKLKALILRKEQKDLTEVVNGMLDEIGNLDTFKGKVGFAVSHRKAIGMAGKKLVTDKEFRNDVSASVKKGKELGVKYHGTIQQLKNIKEELLG